MVILVYIKQCGQLPATLTELYENFILQTIRRHVKRHNADPQHENVDIYTIDNLTSLPLQLKKPLQEMCKIAYNNLVDAKIAFSARQIEEKSLSEADNLGLMTTFVEYDEKMYQFLHLSIQEFLAAWWITKYEKTEEVFKDHFQNNRFRLCLRFVAGLSHLDSESYQQYFKLQQIDVQCKKEPLSGLAVNHLTWFNKYPEFRTNYVQSVHVTSDDFDHMHFPVFLLHLLYEAQNKDLCQAFAQSIENNSLCFCNDVMQLSSFEWLCLSYFISNSNITWNHLHFETLYHLDISVFTAGLTNAVKCKRMEILLHFPFSQSFKLFQPSFLHNIEECYCVLYRNQYFSTLVLLQFLNLPQLRILHLIIERSIVDPPPFDTTCCIKECSDCLEQNSMLQELKIEFYASDNSSDIDSVIISVIKGVTNNKTMTSLSLDAGDYDFLHGGMLLEQLLKNNKTLKALSLVLNMTSLKVLEMNTPLIALEIIDKNKVFLSLLSHVKDLHCLIMFYPLPDFLFFCHPSLQSLSLQLDTAESAIKLFTSIQTNMALKALRVVVKEKTIFTCSMGTSLQDMLTKNQTLKYIDFRYYPIPVSFLPFLITGLRHNNCLEHLGVDISLSDTEQIKTFFDVISHKKMVELHVGFTLDQSHSCENANLAMGILLYEHVLPAITSMLQSNTVIRIVWIRYNNYCDHNAKENWTELAQCFYKAIFFHPVLEYIRVIVTYKFKSLLETAFEHHKMTLIGIHKQEQPHRPLPIVKFSWDSALHLEY